VRYRTTPRNRGTRKGGAILAALILSAPAYALPAQSDPPSPKPTPAPNPLTISGFFRSYDFTRQNASNNPGAHTVNQATWNNAVSLHADYHFPGRRWFIGGTYFYANPLSACAGTAAHVKGAACITQTPPSTNPDDTVPGFKLSTLMEAYAGYSAYNVVAKIGNQIFVSPWAGAVDTRVKPAAFQGAYFSYSPAGAWTFEAAGMIRFEPRTSSEFVNSTLLTSYPAGNQGMASNIFVPCYGSACTGIPTSGFIYAHAGFTPKSANYSLNAYDWRVADITNIVWADAHFTLAQNRWKPYVALQGGFEKNIGASVVGKIDSSLIGVQLGFSVTRRIVLAGSFVSLPWHYDTVDLPHGVKCTNTGGKKGYYQIVTNGMTLPYFLPVNAAQCETNAGGTTTIAYGGWASPYTDNYATNPVFTTQVSQGIPDRRAAGTSWKIGATYTSIDQRFILIASDAWYDYGNAIAPQRTTEWNLDGTYRFHHVLAGPYKGLQLRYRYAQRTYSNTFTLTGVQILGGVPFFKYNRAMLEYDF